MSETERLRIELENARRRIAELETTLAEQRTESAALEVLAEKYHALFEYAGDVVLVVAPETGLITEANTTAIRRLGYGRDELVKLRLADLEVYEEGQEPSWSTSDSGTIMYQTQFKHRTGVLIPVEVSARILSAGGRERLLCVVRDLTRRRQLETDLRKFSWAVEQSPNSIMITDLQGNLEYVNPRFEALTGYARAEVLGQKPRILQSGLTPPEVYDEMWAELTAGRSWSGEFVNRKKNGEVYWEHALISPLRDPTGRPRHYVAIKADITGRKHAEIEREALINDLDAFAHSVAHDLKSPLSLVVGYADMLIDSLETLPADETRDALHQIETSSLKMGRIIDALLLLASVRKQQAITTVPLRMESLVRGAMHSVQILAEERSASITLPEEPWPVVMGHAPWIEEVWTNYLSNAIKYGGEPPQITLGTAPRDDDTLVWFYVRDNGAGIPAEQIPQLFTQFSRLAVTQAAGYGLGLSIVKRIMDRLGGQVRVESTPGQGSTFWFALPGVRTSTA